MTFAKVINKVRGGIARTIISVVAWLARGRPIPLDMIRFARLIAADQSQLLPTHRHLGGHVADPVIAGDLKGIELGHWALGPRSLGVLSSVVSTLRPGLIVEFGSGASTVALASAMRHLGEHGPGVAIVSLEQDPFYADRTRRLLMDAGLAGTATVLVAPLAEQVIEGVRTTCYDIPGDLENAIVGRKADLVVIDGPVGPPGVRFGTLPLARRYVAANARFVLDDAMRDGEIDIARRWRRLPYVRIDGVQLVEKGLLIGTVHGK